MGVSLLSLQSLFAFQWTGLAIGVAIVIGMMGFYLLPFLIKANRDGKKELGPLNRLSPNGGITLGAVTPPGAGDNNPGKRGNPAPGQSDGQADPYGPRAQRQGPPVHS
jgi:hypothetical protein